MNKEENKEKRAVPESALWKETLYGKTFEETFIAEGGDLNDSDAVHDFMSEWDARYTDTVVAEPTMTGLQWLAETEKIWVGTESELFEKLKDYINPECQKEGPFPSSYEEMMQHLDDIYELTPAFRPIEGGFDLLDRRDFTDEEAKGYHAPGWSKERPMLVAQRGAADTPEYHETMIKLARYERPLLLAVLKSTQKKTYWHGTTSQLAERLNRYYPYSAVDKWVYWKDDWSEFPSALGLLELYKLVDRYAEILAEFKLEVTPNKSPEGKTYWTITAPPWLVDNSDSMIGYKAHMAGWRRKGIDPLEEE